MARQKMDKNVRRRELPCIRLSRLIHRDLVVRGVVPMSVERKKKVLKKQRRSRKKIDGKKDPL
jgi:hypothetical protein